MALQKQLIPPFRYAIVEDSFFRGAYPTIKNFRFLRRLHLKTLVSLTPEAHPNRDMREFCEHEGITVHNFFVDKFQDGVTLTNTKVIQVLQIIIRPENLPVYLHCLDGTHITGLVVMCFRKLQSWNLSTSTAEFCQFEKDGEISREESQFVESFRGEIEIPPVIPKWLWQAEKILFKYQTAMGVRTVKHPTFRLRLLPAITPEKEEDVSVPAAGARHHAHLLSKSRNLPGGVNNPLGTNDRDVDSFTKHQGGSELGTTADHSPSIGLTPLAGTGFTEGAVIYGDGDSGQGLFGGRTRHSGMSLGFISGGEDASNQGGVVYKAPPMQALDRNEVWSGTANVGFPRKGFQEVHESESRLSLEALSLEGLNGVGTRRMPGWPRQAWHPRSMVTISGKNISSREQEASQLGPRR